MNITLPVDDTPVSGPPRNHTHCTLEQIKSTCGTVSPGRGSFLENCLHCDSHTPPDCGVDPTHWGTAVNSWCRCIGATKQQYDDGVLPYYCTGKCTDPTKTTKSDCVESGKTWKGATWALHTDINGIDTCVTGQYTDNNPLTYEECVNEKLRANKVETCVSSAACYNHPPTCGKCKNLVSPCLRDSDCVQWYHCMLDGSKTSAECKFEYGRASLNLKNLNTCLIKNGCGVDPLPLSCTQSDDIQKSCKALVPPKQDSPDVTCLSCVNQIAFRDDYCALQHPPKDPYTGFKPYTPTQLEQELMNYCKGECKIGGCTKSLTEEMS